MIDCYDDGALRAYLDGETAASARATLHSHLATCAACQERLETQRAQMARVGALLTGPAASPAPQLALARLRAAQAARPSEQVGGRAPTHPIAPSPDSQGHSRTNQRRNSMPISRHFWSGPRRALLASLAAIVALAGLLALPPVRAAADQLLQVFRVKTVLFVPTSPERIRQLEQLDFDKNTLFVSKPTVSDAKPPRTVSSAGEAAAALGGAVAQPTKFPSAPTSTEFTVRDPARSQFQINVEAARQLLTLMDVNDVTIPDALGSAPIVVETSAAAEVRYQGANYEMTLFQTRSPNVTLPDGVDLSQLGRAALRLLGMEPALAEAASRQIDWNSTLIFPFPADTNNIRQLTIGDAPGLLVGGGNGGGQHWQLYWQRGEQLYMLEGRGGLRDADMIDALVAAAESVQ